MNAITIIRINLRYLPATGLAIAFLSCFLLSCNPAVKKTLPESSLQLVEKDIPNFNADSACQYTRQQVDFGPRVPNTPAHVACGDYFVRTLKRFGANVTEQKAILQNYAGTRLNARNIIASYQPENINRILLFAHWDTRPFADHDPNPENWRTPIDGANDGAGGCGVLLEVARQLQLKQPAIGVDLILFDAEDWGAPLFESNIPHPENSYCLGSAHWAKNPHTPGYNARYGILLDMVGAPDATFYKERYSVRYASRILNKVWETAQSAGFGRYFIQAEGGFIEDDHVQVIRHRNIPCIDIIHLDPNGETGFGHYWHTLHDSMDNVSKETLYAVGQTLLLVIYNEK
jgi:Zn-dependent M28 family amino/carboxypeptidase